MRYIIKKTVLATAVFCLLLFNACSFSPPEPVKTPPSKFVVPEQLERHELLALMHLQENHEVSPEQLEKKVMSFLKINSTARSASSPESAITGMQKITRVIENGFASTVKDSRSAVAEPKTTEIPFYLFSVSNPTEKTSGYALTIADMRFPSVITVVEDGKYEDGSNPFASVFSDFLSDYIDETIFIYNNITNEDINSALARSNVIENNSRTTYPGGILTDDNFNNTINLMVIGQPSPLITTKWSQRLGYNSVVNSVYGADYPAGCLAVAMAQIMAYHQWPERPEGTIDAPNIGGITSFIDPYTGLTKYFSCCVVYEWSYMKLYPQITEFGSSTTHNRYKMQIGVLMLEIGSNVFMDYGPGSYAYFSDAPDALVAMGYNPPNYINYDTNEVQYSINSGMPLLAYGNNGSSGHAWIIDNYAFSPDFWKLPGGSGPQIPVYTMFVHCNIGSGGAMNGWYLDIFDSSSSFFYKYNTLIITDIYPNK